MKSNVGWIDRIIRLAIGVAAVWLFFSGAQPAPAWEWAALVVGLILGVTGLVGFCPLYSVLGIHTNKAT
ncbi:MAG: DUF2892 domain-containing protein [Parvularculaceae bacterium]